MNPAPTPTPIQIRETADGTLTYLVAMPPEALPQLRARDIEAAWYRARGAALGEQWGDLRIFHFLRADGSRTDLALTDRIAGLTTAYGLSLCLRLLAHAKWAAPFFALERDGARLEPALLAAAAEATLNARRRVRSGSPAHPPRRDRTPRAHQTPWNPGMTNRLLLATLLITLAACTPPAPDRGTAAQRAACSQRADDIFAKRNPGDKYRTDQYISSQRDSPFGGYAPADPTADLQARYSRDRILTDCMRRSTAQPTS